MKKSISRADLASPSRAHRLVLIDGNAILHRAYHALPPLTTPDGTVVNAVYGFISMLIKIWNDLKPTHLAVAFDRPEPTFRKTLFTGYQATRPKMEDALSSQVAMVHEVVASFGIPIFEAAGFEADDVLATLAKRVSDERKISGADLALPSRAHLPTEVIIVTGDRDLLQLVDDHSGVQVFMPTKGLSEGKLYGEAQVVEKMGVRPSQIPDLKALMGDASDNYPGVAGIGPKTAVELITRYGSVEEMYNRIRTRGTKGTRSSGKKEDEVSEGIIEKLVKGEEHARLSKDLATIRSNAPVAEGELREVHSLDTPEAREKLTALHFPSLLKRLERPMGDALTTITRPRKNGQSEKKQQTTENKQQELF